MIDHTKPFTVREWRLLARDFEHDGQYTIARLCHVAANALARRGLP